MAELRTVGAEDWQLQRDTRLAALKDAPTAFGSTYAHEVAFSDEEWKARSRRMAEGTSISGVIAVDGQGNGVGLAAGLLDAEVPAIANLISMWVVSEHRRSGVGVRIVEHVIAWAKSRACSEVRLAVTYTNAGAIAFYERLGFVATGKTEQHRAYPELHLIEMRREL